MNSIPNTTVIVAARDGYFTNPLGLKNLYSPTLMLSKTAEVEVQSRLEFDLTLLPSDVLILRAAFQFDLQMVQLAGGEKSLTLHCGGFAGTGTLPATSSCSARPIAAMTLTRARRVGRASLALDARFVQQTLAGGWLGLCLHVSAPITSSQANILMLRSAKNARATLRPTVQLQYVSADGQSAEGVVVQRPDSL